MPDRINLGVIGTGRMGGFHSRNIVRHLPEANITALCDIRLDVAEAVGAAVGIDRVVRDYRELLDDPTIDAVLVASSTDTHAFMIEDAAKAGKHIFCEKPIHMDLASIDRALSEVERAGVKLQIGFNRRFDRNFQHVHQLVADGRVGEPCILHISSRDPEPPPLSYVQVAGCIFLDMTIHDFDMARFQMGEVQEVFAAGSLLVAPELGEADDIDTAVTTLRFENGAVGVIDNSRRAVYGYDQRVEVFGSSGSAAAGNEVANTVVLADAGGFHSPKLPLFFIERYAETYVSEIRSFVDCVLHDKTPQVTGRDGRAAVALAYAAIKSWKENRPVKVSEVG